jgi:hypothetical protein
MLSTYELGKVKCQPLKIGSTLCQLPIVPPLSYLSPYRIGNIVGIVSLGTSLRHPGNRNGIT